MSYHKMSILLILAIFISSLTADAGNISPGTNNSIQTLVCGGNISVKSVDSYVGNLQQFNMTVEEFANITWYKNIFNRSEIAEVFNQTNVTTSLYNVTATEPGKWNVTAIADYINNTYCGQNLTQAWIWTVTIYVPPDSSSPGGGGGGGGGGAASDEPFDNILKSERREGNLLANISVTYSFTTPEIAIYQVLITGKEIENDVSIRIEALKNTSKLVKGPAPGIVYQNENIFVKSYRVSDIKIRFKIENSWLEANNLKGTDIGLFKWNISEWVPLEVDMINKSDAYTYFDADIPGTSKLAISGFIGSMTPEKVPFPIKSQQNPKPVTTRITIPADKKSSGFEIVITIMIVYIVSIFRKRGK